MRRLKLITFDLDNTLWSVDDVIRRAERACSLWLSERYTEHAEQLSPASLYRLRDQLVADRPDYLHQLTRLRMDTLRLALSRIGLTPSEADRITGQAFDVFHDVRNQVVFFPGALDVLEKLADSYQLGALSNGNADLEKIGIADLFLFHHSAESVGRGKPAPDMFRAALDSAEVNASQSLHIGDHPLEDVDAARREGFAAIWANLLDQEWPENLPQPVHRIRHLHELTDMMPLFDD